VRESRADPSDIRSSSLQASRNPHGLDMLNVERGGLWCPSASSSWPDATAPSAA